MREKIHCIEAEKKGFDDIPFDKTRLMVGFYEPVALKDNYDNIHGEYWTVTMHDESFMDVDTQEHAQMLANQEMIKAMLMKLLEVK